MPVARCSVPTCPECGSDETAIAYHRANATTLFCDDCGCVWRVEQPAADRRIRPDAAGEIGRSHKGDTLILLIEDDESTRETTARILRLAAHTVLTARDGQDALAILDRAR